MILSKKIRGIGRHILQALLLMAIASLLSLQATAASICHSPTKSQVATLQAMAKNVNNSYSPNTCEALVKKLEKQKILLLAGNDI